MFTDFGGTRPAPTLFVIAVSDFMQQYIVVMIIAAVAGLYGLKKYYATPGGKLQIDALMLKLPVVGDLIRKIAVAQFTRTFGTLLQSGVPIMEGLEIVARISGNKDRKSTRLNSSHLVISYAVFCLKKKKRKQSSRSP